MTILRKRNAQPPYAHAQLNVCVIFYFQARIWVNLTHLERQVSCCIARAQSFGWQFVFVRLSVGYCYTTIQDVEERSCWIAGDWQTFTFCKDDWSNSIPVLLWELFFWIRKLCVTLPFFFRLGLQWSLFMQCIHYKILLFSKYSLFTTTRLIPIPKLKKLIT